MMKNGSQNRYEKIIAVFMIFVILSSYLPSLYSVVQAVNDTTGSYVNDTTNILSDTTGELSEDIEINITDEKLKEYFLSSQDDDGNGKITKSEMEKVEYFSYSSYDSNYVVDLDVLKYCTNLTQFYIYGEYFTNIDVLKEFKKLESVGLQGVNVNNVNWDNISKNIDYLDLNSNNLEDISFITKFENLKYIDLKCNKIKDLSPLKQLKNLNTVYVDFSEENENIIEELSAQNIYCSQDVNINNIKVAKGKIIEIDVPLIGQKVLDKNSKLYSENISYSNDNSNGNIKVSDDKTKIIIDATNLEIEENIHEFLYLSSDNAHANINIYYSVYEEVDEKNEIEISDKTLKKLLLENYDYDLDGIITDFDMLQITNLSINDSDIKDITCLEYAKNMKSLWIQYFTGDISALLKLDKLEELYLSYTSITDLSYLKELKNLNLLQINTSTYENNLIDFVSINELPQLKTLIIYDNAYFQEIDINKISNLLNLNSLRLQGKISNIDMIGTKFTNLSELRLTTKNILENIEFVAKLTNLETLDLTDNIINDITPLKGLEKLKNVYLMKNPINTKELNNAETLQILRNRGTYVDVAETNTTVNIDFKDIEFKNALIADGKDLNKDNEISIAEMEAISYLNFNNATIESIEEIEYAKNVYSLNIDNTSIEDLTPILKFKDLNHIYISGKIKPENFETITKLTNLTSLSISNNGYTSNEKIDISGIENLTNLTYLYLSGDINLEKIEKISALTKLNNLSLNIYTNNYNEQYILDLKGIDKLINLNTLSLSSNVKNIEEIKKLENLKDISIYSRVYDLNENKLSIDKVMSLLNELNIEETKYYNFSEILDLGNILQDTTKEISLKDLNIFKNFYNENNIFYDPDVTISSYSNNLTIDNQQQKIILNTNELGRNFAYLNIDSENVRGNINLEWRNYIEGGDTEKEINITDINLKNRLLETDDIDKDGKITEHDMINLVDLYLDSMGREDKIKNLDGLQHAINLKSIDVLWNNISDLTPILNLENIEYANFDGNLLTDVRFLNNVKWSNEIWNICLQNNFIDFSNNENYLALKNFYDRNVEMDEEYKEMEISYSVNVQRYGNVNEIDNIVPLEENLKNKLIEIGVDGNSDNQITRRELYYMDPIYAKEIWEELDLSDSNITDLSGLEYIDSTVINLSNNNISDITPLTKNKCLYEINLSNNNISNIIGIEKINNLSIINLAHNNIENIEPLTNLLNHNGYRDFGIDLSNNKISDISCVKDWKNMYYLNLSNNKITDISSLKDYDFKVDGENEYAESLTIDLSGNDINLTNAGNKAAKEVFDNKGANLKLVDTSKAKLYVLDKNGIFTAESNLGAINTEISEDSDYEFVPEKNRKYYPDGSNVDLAGIFINSVYYDSAEHDYEIKQKGFDEEIVVTGAIRTKNTIGNNQYLTVELTVPEGYIGNTAQIGILNDAEIVEKTRNTITIKMLLNTDSSDSNYLSFKASILLKEKEQVIEDITNKEEIIDHIKGEHDVTLDMTTDIVEVSNEVFETLAEKEDIKLKVETENAVWNFSSDNIENTEITLNPKVQISDSRFEDMSNSGVEDGIFIKFEHEGVLPGKAEIELDVSDCNKYEDGKTIYLYYFDSEKNQYRYISSTRSENNIVKITLEHCSEYVLTEEMLYTIGDVNQDGKISLLDCTKILAHVKRTQELKDHELLAADVNGDGKISLLDYTKVLAHVKRTALLK